MDQSAVSYFKQKFDTHDADELGDLVARRSNLSEEAVEALNRVLAERGLNETDFFTAPRQNPTAMDDDGMQDLEAQTKSARNLWRGLLAKKIGAKLQLN